MSIKISSIASIALLLASSHVSAKTTFEGSLPHRVGTPVESTPGLDTLYTDIRASAGQRLRVILTRPTGTHGPLPAVFLTQWVSCDSSEFPAVGRPSLLRDLAKESGMVLIRVERSGTGDSEGVPCSQLDYDTEVQQYREAFDHVRRLRWVDPAEIFIFGSSLGGTTAPLVAAGKKVAGIIVQGAGAVSYLERMINFERLYVERSGKYGPDVQQQEMLRRIAFQELYLGEGKNPVEIAKERPDLAGVWSSILGAEPASQYGRPLAWHHQAASNDFTAAWSRVDAPVLVIHGEYDQFEPAHGHQLIADTVNSKHPGDGLFFELPKTDHDLYTYADARSAYARQGGTPNFRPFLNLVVKWLHIMTTEHRAPRADELSTAEQ